MPNWARGHVFVTGTHEGLKSFIERFINAKEPTTIPGKRFFARSFLIDPRDEVLHNAALLFKDKAGNEKATIELFVEFAWSAHACIIEGKPQKNPTECITLTEACVEDKVSVEIQTTEMGMGIREEISCDKTGELTHFYGDLTAYRCRDCGEINHFDPYTCPDEMECSACGGTNMVWLNGASCDAESNSKGETENA